MDYRTSTPKSVIIVGLLSVLVTAALTESTDAEVSSRSDESSVVLVAPALPSP